MPDTVPPWLESMRADLGVEEIPGPEVNPRIIAKARLPGVKFPNVPGLVAYGLLYKSDDTQAWCGAECGGCFAEVGVPPPFNKDDDLKSYFWAASWRTWGVACSIRVGATVCFDGHVTMVNRIISASQIECIGGNQGSPKGGAVTKSTRNTGDVRACRWPDDASLAAAGLPQFSLSAAPGIATAPFQPEIKIGSTGGFVTEAQNLLGLAATGIFDDAMDAAVREFQSRHALSMVDGEIGDETWPVLRASKGQPAPVTSAGLSPEAIARIVSIAGSSALASVNWSGRGVAPRGYIKGMAVTFAHVYAKWKAGDSSARVMGALPAGDTAHDALAWYGVTNITVGASTLRALFALLIGLGMRESSGNYSEGRDTSASNTSADTAEAGLFQQSWNSHSASPELAKLFAIYSAASVEGFLSIFREGVSAKSTDNYGSGDGAAFQALCKSKPAFAVECAAVGLRVLRAHWGPINRREAEIRIEADALLKQVQAIVDAIPAPIEGEVLDPNDPGPIIAATATPFWMTLILNLLKGQQMTNPTPGQGLDLSKLFGDFARLLPILQDPILLRFINDQPVKRSELMTLPPEIFAALTGHAMPQLLLPQPATTAPDPAKVEPAKVEAAPASVVVTPAPSGILPGLAGGLSITGLIAYLMDAGTLGTPFGMGQAPTSGGSLGAIIGALSPVIGAATGSWWMTALGKVGPIISAVRAASKTKTT